MADFGQSTRSLSPVDFKTSEGRGSSLFSFPTSLKEEHRDNKVNNKNGVCEDCLDDSPKSKAISTQENTVLDQRKINYTSDPENSMFHDFSTSTTFWSPVSTEDSFVPSGVPQPVNGVHFPPNSPMISQSRRVTGPNPMNHQPRRQVPNNSPYINHPKPMPAITHLNSMHGGWNQQHQSISGWPNHQHISNWGHRHSNSINSMNLSQRNRPQSLPFPNSARFRNNRTSHHPMIPRSALSTQSITQGLQNLSLRQPVDGTILDDISSLGNSNSHTNELSNSLYTYQVRRIRSLGTQHKFWKYVFAYESHGLFRITDT